MANPGKNLLAPLDPDPTCGVPLNDRKLLAACRRPALALLQACKDEGKATGINIFNIVRGLPAWRNLGRIFVVIHYVDMITDGTATVRVWNTRTPENATEDPLVDFPYSCSDSDEKILVYQQELLPLIRRLVDERSQQNLDFARIKMAIKLLKNARKNLACSFPGIALAGNRDLIHVALALHGDGRFFMFAHLIGIPITWTRSAKSLRCKYLRTFARFDLSGFRAVPFCASGSVCEGYRDLSP